MWRGPTIRWVARLAKATMNVAVLVQQQYARLAKTGKPQGGEWTVLAGFVLTLPSAQPQVVALGTGTKCLTATQVGADMSGACLHDTHAEVCARRSLLLYLMNEIEQSHSGTSAVVQPAARSLASCASAHFSQAAVPCFISLAQSASSFELHESEAAARTQERNKNSLSNILWPSQE